MKETVHCGGHALRTAMQSDARALFTACYMLLSNFHERNTRLFAM